MSSKTLAVLCFVLYFCKCHEREKRHLIYVNSGVFKFIVGISVPTDAKLPGGSLNWLTNIQGLYRLPDNITYFEPYKVLQKRSPKNSFNRSILYAAIEKSIFRLGTSGTDCLLQFICEAAQLRSAYRNNGLIGDTISALLSPLNDKPSTASAYLKAQLQGMQIEVDCQQIYPKCTIYFGS